VHLGIYAGDGSVGVFGLRHCRAKCMAVGRTEAFGVGVVDDDSGSAQA